MAAPEYVPHPAAERARVYESPPWNGEGWVASRPGELKGRQPVGARMGHPGPDQGYVLHLARRFEGRLALAPHEREADAIAGCSAVALKRASLFGRAPVIHDLTVAFTIWGFLDGPDPTQVAMRRRYLDGVADEHHYMELRRIADLVPAKVLRLTPEQVQAQRAAQGWESFFARRPAPS